MPQISLYIDESTLRKVEDIAKKNHMSISKWVAEQVREKVSPAYPAGFESLFGSIQDDSFVEAPELLQSSDLEREAL